MFIDLNLLAKELARGYVVQTYHVRPMQMVTDFALLPTPYDPEKQKLDPDRAYICSFWQLKQFDPHLELPPLICVVEQGADPNAVFFVNRSVITLHGMTLMDAMLAITNAAYYMGSKASLAAEVSRTLLRCTTITELLEEGFRALKMPLIVTDRDQQILYFTDPNQVPMPAYREFLSSEYIPVGHPVTSDLDSSWDENSVPFLAHGTDELLPVLCKPLKAAGQVVGYLHIPRFDREFDQMDFGIAELVGNLIAAAVWKQSRPGMDSRVRDKKERFLRDLLDNRLGDADGVTSRQKELGLTFRKHLYAMIINLNGGSDHQRIPFTDLAAMVQSSIPHSRAFLFRNGVFVLAESDTIIESFEKFLSPLSETAERYGLIVGISNSMPSVLQLRDAGFQARKAVQLGSRLKPDSWIYPYQEYSIYYITELCLKNEVLDGVCRWEVLMLSDYCRENGPELMDTLRAYLKCGRSKSAAAKVLYVHVNTVKYRIAQIEELTKLNLDDDDTALQLMLSFRMLDYADKFGGYEPLEF